MRSKRPDPPRESLAVTRSSPRKRSWRSRAHTDDRVSCSRVVYIREDVPSSTACRIPNAVNRRRYGVSSLAGLRGLLAPQRPHSARDRGRDLRRRPPRPPTRRRQSPSRGSCAWRSVSSSSVRDAERSQPAARRRSTRPNAATRNRGEHKRNVAALVRPPTPLAQVKPAEEDGLHQPEHDDEDFPDRHRVLIHLVGTW